MAKHLAWLAMAWGLAGCTLAEPPFLYTNIQLSVVKQHDQMLQTGQIAVCYHDPDLPKARVLALSTCQQYGLQMMERVIQHNQCKLTAPEKLVVRCYDPKMRFANGAWVNPLSLTEVHLWREEQQRITGKPFDQIYAGPQRDLPELSNPSQRVDVDVPLKIDN